MEGGREIFTGAGAAAPRKTVGKKRAQPPLQNGARNAPKWCFALHWHVLRAAQCRRPSTAVPKRREALHWHFHELPKNGGGRSRPCKTGTKRFLGAFHLAAFYESPVRARSIISWQRW